MLNLSLYRGGISKTVVASFFDELSKMAMPNPEKMKSILSAIGRSAGKFGPSSVPRAVPKTLKIGPKGITKLPLAPGM